MIAETREEAIFAVASDYLVWQERPGIAPGVRSVRVGSPEDIRRRYLTAAGYGELAEPTDSLDFEIDLTHGDDGVIGIKLWIRDRATLNRLKTIIKLDGWRAFAPADDGNMVVDPWEFLARTLRYPGTHASRGPRLDPVAVAASLAVFYLTRRGGGTQTLDRAALLFQHRIGKHPDHYLAGWPSTYHRLIRELRGRFGPLTPAEADRTGEVAGATKE